jgi:hypothetical protein
MHIHRDMFGYASAALGLPSTQTGGWLQLAAGGDSDGDAGPSGANPIMQQNAFGKLVSDLGKIDGYVRLRGRRRAGAGT